MTLINVGIGCYNLLIIEPKSSVLSQINIGTSRMRTVPLICIYLTRPVSSDTFLQHSLQFFITITAWIIWRSLQLPNWPKCSTYILCFDYRKSNCFWIFRGIINNSPQDYQCIHHRLIEFDSILKQEASDRS